MEMDFSVTITMIIAFSKTDKAMTLLVKATVFQIISRRVRQNSHLKIQSNLKINRHRASKMRVTKKTLRTIMKTLMLNRNLQSQWSNKRMKRLNRLHQYRLKKLSLNLRTVLIIFSSAKMEVRNLFRVDRMKSTTQNQRKFKLSSRKARQRSDLAKIWMSKWTSINILEITSKPPTPSEPQP